MAKALFVVTLGIAAFAAGIVLMIALFPNGPQWCTFTGHPTGIRHCAPKIVGLGVGMALAFGGLGLAGVGLRAAFRTAVGRRHIQG